MSFSSLPSPFTTFLAAGTSLAAAARREYAPQHLILHLLHIAKHSLYRFSYTSQGVLEGERSIARRNFLEGP